jgi:hypothetical protein
MHEALLGPHLTPGRGEIARMKAELAAAKDAQP